MLLFLIFFYPHCARAAIPLDWESPTKTFEVPAGDRKYIAEFYKQDGEQYLIYERYKYKRVG